MGKSKEVTIGGTYKHVSGGLYHVNCVLLDPTGYESRFKIGKWQPRRAVEYTQLYEGEYPKGTVWVRSEKDFLRRVRRFPQFWISDAIFKLVQK